MKQPLGKKREFSSSKKSQTIIAVVLLGIAFLIMIALLVLWFPKILQQQPAQVAPTLPPTSVAPTLPPTSATPTLPPTPVAPTPVAPTPVAPTPQCVEPTIKVGSSPLLIHSIARADDGSIPILASNEEAAYWVEGTKINYVFVLSPTPDNSALSENIKTGENITITWADCTTEDYVVNAIAPQAPIDSSVFDQIQGGVTLIMPVDSLMASLIIQAVRPEALITVTPEPVDLNQIRAEIDFGETSVSEDDKTIQINLTVTNTGSVVILLNASDLSISSENTQTLSPLSVEPSLPQEVQPGKSLSLTATFPNPDDKNSVLNVLDTSIELFYILP